ncbi:MAG: SIS domain-containing protein [Methanolinea sp.]|nr:SIS domain-containing protein [Methanolinea sp.]
MQEIPRIPGLYRTFLEKTLDSIERMDSETGTLSRLIDEAHAVHIFGFGRSGTAALAMAIRLRHFLAPERQVFWLGDGVRDPIRKDDLVILFSGSGTREEVLHFLRKAEGTGAHCVAVTGSPGSALARGARLTIVLPSIGSEVCYGGGDFELAAWTFQEVFLTMYGRSRAVPDGKITFNHV